VATSTSKHINVVAVMPYNRDEVVASVTEFYTFLTTHLHFYPSELKTPPPTGWAKITPHNSDEKRKSDTVIDLLRLLPYLPSGNGQEKWIYDTTICADYTNETVKQDIELDIPEVVENCPWEKLQDSSRVEAHCLAGDAVCKFSLPLSHGSVSLPGILICDSRMLTHGSSWL
jgi:hypothetical protein